MFQRSCDGKEWEDISEEEAKSLDPVLLNILEVMATLDPNYAARDRKDGFWYRARCSDVPANL